MKKLLLPLLILISVFSSCEKKDKFDGYTRTVIYRPEDYGSKYYRIPAIITAKDGSLVVFTDKRKENETDLPEDIDILCNYSTDGGLTWSEPYTLAQGFGYMESFGDCAVAHSKDDNGLIAVFVGGQGFWKSRPSHHNHTYKSMSYDNGRTWTEPEDITHFIFGKSCQDSVRSKWRASFCASGNGLLTSTGRIMFVACIRETSAYTISNYVIYSDDNGVTWNVSGRASVGGDEAKVVELNNGDILMSIRTAGKRWYNISHDGGITWNETTSEWDDLIGPACNGDLIRYDENTLLHSLPKGDSRRDVAIYISKDEGKTWNEGKVIVPRYSAYSSLCVLPDKTIGMFVEEREVDTTSYEMVFYRFPIEYLEVSESPSHRVTK